MHSAFFLGSLAALTACAPGAGSYDSFGEEGEEGPTTDNGMGGYASCGEAILGETELPIWETPEGAYVNVFGVDVEIQEDVNRPWIGVRWGTTAGAWNVSCAPNYGDRSSVEVVEDQEEYQVVLFGFVDGEFRLSFEDPGADPPCYEPLTADAGQGDRSYTLLPLNSYIPE